MTIYFKTLKVFRGVAPTKSLAEYGIIFRRGCDLLDNTIKALFYEVIKELTEFW